MSYLSPKKYLTPDYEMRSKHSRKGRVTVTVRRKVSPSLARRRRSAALKKSIAKSLKQLRLRGGGRLDAWQDKYPQYPGNSWATAPTICQFPGQAETAFKGPVAQRGGCGCKRQSGSGYGVSETYFGRKPVGYVGPKSSPYPSEPVLWGAARRKVRRSRK